MTVYKVNVSFDPELLDEIDKTAEDLGMSRSGFIAEAAVRYVADVRNLSAEEQRRKDIQRARSLFQRIGSEVSSEELLARLRADRDRDGTEE